MKKTIFLLSVVLTPLWSWSMMQSGDTLRLSAGEVVDMLKTNNLKVKATELRMDAAEENLKAQRGLYYPSVDLSVNYVKMDEALTLDMTPMRDAVLPAYDLVGGQTAYLEGLTDYMAATGTMDAATYSQLMTNIDALQNGNAQAVNAINNGEWEKTIQEDQFANVSGTVTMPIYTGGNIRAANNAAKARVELAKAEGEQVVLTEISTMLNTYFALQLALEVEKVRQQVLEGMQLHLSNTKKLEENGMVAHAQALHAEVAVVEANRQLKKAKNDVSLLQTALQNVLNTKAVIQPTSKLFIANNTATLQQFVVGSQTANPALKQLNAQETLTQQAIAKERAAYLPNIVAFGRADLADYQYSEYAPEWIVGVSMRINLFDGMTKVHKTQAAKIQQREVQLWQEKVKLDLETGVTKVYQQMLQASENYSAAESALEFVEEYLRITRKSFAEGFSTSADVTDAQMNLAKVQTDMLVAKYQYDVALIKLLELQAENEKIINYVNR